jgi:hypothetical protein
MTPKARRNAELIHFDKLLLARRKNFLFVTLSALAVSAFIRP